MIIDLIIFFLLMIAVDVLLLCAAVVQFSVGALLFVYPDLLPGQPPKDAPPPLRAALIPPAIAGIIAIYVGLNLAVIGAAQVQAEGWGAVTWLNTAHQFKIHTWIGTATAGTMSWFSAAFVRAWLRRHF